MTLRSRRAALACLAAVFALHAACDGASQPRLRQHVLDRIGYGPDAWSLQRIEELGVRGYIDEQLAPASLDDAALESEIRSRYPVARMSYLQSRVTYSEYTGNPDTGPGAPIRDASRAKVQRAVRSKKQLEQVLVDFWYNHFNVDAIVEEARWGFVTLERDAIRAHVWGRFADMLRATARNPGMLDYLDNAVNFRDGYVHEGVRRGLNENYARELLELHTVGVDGGYAQADVRETARAFTGWTTAPLSALTIDGFRWLADGHDSGEKRVMGLVLPAQRGEADGIDLIEYLAMRPATAERIARKLCQRFVSETPPETLVQTVAQAYLASGGQLRETVRAVLYAPEFLDLRYAGTKVKRPLVYVASLARAVGVRDAAVLAESVTGRLSQMGETLYRSGPPTGYPDASRYWVGEGAYVVRLNLAWQAAHGNVGFAAPTPVVATAPAEVVFELQQRFRRPALRPATRAALEALVAGLPLGAQGEEGAATLLASPDFLVH